MFLRPVGFETTIRGAFPVWEYQQTNARLALTYRLIGK
jgi:iron complex outermembrane receptor protein